MEIRTETEQDHKVIRNLLADAFPSAAEADLVEKLRSDGDVIHSLVYLMDGEVVGHAMTSILTAPFKAIALAPVATHSAFRKQGIAGQLVRTITKSAENEGWQGIFVLGDPAYYGRFGFAANTAEDFTTPYAGPYFMAMPLGAPALPVSNGPITHATAFLELG